MEYAIQLLIPLVAGLYLGRKLDMLFDASPWGIVVSAIVGLAAGVYLMYAKLQYKAKKEAKAAEAEARKDAIRKRVATQRSGGDDEDKDPDDHPYGL